MPFCKHTEATPTNRTNRRPSMMMLFVSSTCLILLSKLQVVSSLSVSPSSRKSTELQYLKEPVEDLVTTTEDRLIGQVLKDEYVIGKYIPVASEKCELYEAFHVCDSKRKRPMIMKISRALENIQTEYQVYKQVAEELDGKKKDLFVQIFDKIDLGEQRAILMEKGEDNLRFCLGKKGPYKGEALRSAMKRVIRTVEALHERELVWTEVKAENFVVKRDGTIKAIDLESVIPHGEYLRMYTAEACPPEFPIDDLHRCLPEIRPDISFDVWGLGITLFEIATGRPFFKQGLTDLEFIKEKLRNTQAIEPYLDRKLVSVNPEARKIIKQCLNINPDERPSCSELLKDSYFTHRQLVDVEEGESIVTKYAHARLQKDDQAGYPSFLKLDRLEAVLDSINEVAKKDPKVARDFLQILLEQTPPPQT